MRVLFVHRRGIFSAEGGEQAQIAATALALRSFGLEVDIAPDLPTEFARYELVHFFGLDQDHIDKVKRAQGLPRLLTPVFWDRYQQFGQEWNHQPRSKAMRRMAKWRRQLRRRPERRARRFGLGQFLASETPIPREKSDYNWAAFQEVINEIDLFLPNSEAEMDSVRRCFVLARPPRYAVVHNAIDSATIDQMSDYWSRAVKLDQFLLCSAGVDPRKNQYNLVRALAGVDIPLVFAGQVRDETYAHSVAALAKSIGANVLFLGHLSRPDLNSLYAHASAHILPSYHETPGISNLEAIAYGCPNVSTKIGGLEEYVGEHSLYCNPYSVAHIRQQTLRALDLPRNPGGAAFVRSRYTWENAAKETLSVYQRAKDEGARD